MQVKLVAALIVSCMVLCVSASPIPIIPPLDVEARASPNPSRRDIEELVIAREANPEANPGCRIGCY